MTEHTAPDADADREPEAVEAADPQAHAADHDGHPNPEAVEEFERLAVLRMGGEDIEPVLDALPEEDARGVAEVAIDRVVRTYENL